LQSSGRLHCLQELTGKGTNHNLLPSGLIFA
jgi:hypothetical protein